METTQPLKFSFTPETLQTGSPEEKAAFGTIAIVANGKVLTEGVGIDCNELRTGPRVSGYHLAEWLVWNWWRLRWEPRPPVGGTAPPDWDMAHCMATIGEGYVWPNVTFASDGFQCEVFSSRSSEADTLPATRSHSYCQKAQRAFGY